MTLAYLDPGSGSLIASALVGGVAAAGVAARQARARLSGGFGRKRKQETEFSEDATATEADADAPQADTAEVEEVAGETTTVGSDS